MPDPNPKTRADREWGNAVELRVTEEILYRLADSINALVRSGPIYGQVLLSPEEAAMKRQQMEQQGGQYA